MMRSRYTVRIIGGRWRSRVLRFPDVAGLRPTPDRVRETLFNWLGQDLTGENCLDLYAGSGVLGLEALSRGAESVTMIERNAAAIEALRGNINLLGAERLNLVRGDALEFLRGAHTGFDVVFVDPPYGLGLQERVLALLPPALSQGARVYVESDSVLELPPGWRQLKRSRAGNVHYYLLGRYSDDQGSVSGDV